MNAVTVRNREARLFAVRRFRLPQLFASANCTSRRPVWFEYELRKSHLAIAIVTRDHYCKFWTYLAPITALFAAAAWAHIAGLTVPGIPFAMPRDASTVITVPLLAALLIAESFVAWWYQVRFPTTVWPDRLPLFLLDHDKFNPSRSDASLFQGGCVVAFFIVPTISLAVLFARFWTNSLYCDGSDKLILKRVSLFPQPLADCSTFLDLGSANGPQVWLVSPSGMVETPRLQARGFYPYYVATA